MPKKTVKKTAAGKTAKRGKVLLPIIDKKRPRATKSGIKPRVRAILERTKLARAVLDHQIAGVDMSAYDHLPVVSFPLGKPKPPGLKRKIEED